MREELKRLFERMPSHRMEVFYYFYSKSKRKFLTEKTAEGNSVRLFSTRVLWSLRDDHQMMKVLQSYDTVMLPAFALARHRRLLAALKEKETKESIAKLTAFVAEFSEAQNCDKYRYLQ